MIIRQRDIIDAKKSIEKIQNIIDECENNLTDLNKELSYILPQRRNNLSVYERQLLEIEISQLYEKIEEKRNHLAFWKNGLENKKKYLLELEPPQPIVKVKVPEKNHSLFSFLEA